MRWYVSAADYCAGLALFLAVALPTIKGIAGLGASLNALLVLMVILGIIIKGHVATDRIMPVLPVLGFLGVLLASFAIEPAMLTDFGEFIRYLSLIVITVGMAVLIELRGLRIAMFCVLGWGAGLALYQLMAGFRFTDTFHYLTLGLPIGAMVLIAFCRLFFPKSWPARAAYLSLIALGFSALFTLFGRSPILFPLLIMGAFIVVRLFTIGSLGGFMRYILLAATIAIAAIPLAPLLPKFWIERVMAIGFAIAQGEGEARLDAVYRPALLAIQKNPFGYGLGSSQYVIGYYPHNIWLEALLIGGFIAGWLLLFVVLVAGRASLTVIRQKDFYREDVLASALLAAYLFLTWNVSYDIPSAYGLFAMTTVMLVFRWSSGARHSLRASFDFSVLSDKRGLRSTLSGRPS